MTSLYACLAWLEPPAAGASGPWIDPKYLQPEVLVPFGVGMLLLLVAIVLKAPDIASWHRAKGKRTLDPGQLEELMIGSPPQIVDLRPRQEFVGHRGHIRNAVNIPFSDFPKRLDELDTSHPRPIVLVDETDQLSHEALETLAARGHQWIYVLKGGMRAWRRAKLPVYVFQEKSKH